ncbi:MAG: hypothetical protein EXR69_12585 [Myxococcales bacterium]|nr:hypothetical protein [Myxococcales bacterium]
MIRDPDRAAVLRCVQLGWAERPARQVVDREIPGEQVEPRHLKRIVERREYGRPVGHYRYLDRQSRQAPGHFFPGGGVEPVE